MLDRAENQRHSFLLTPSDDAMAMAQLRSRLHLGGGCSYGGSVLVGARVGLAFVCQNEEVRAMARLGWRRNLVVSMAAMPWLALYGCASGYLDAAGTFASAASSSTPALQGAIDYNHTLCAQRWQIDFFQHRLEGTNTTDGHKTVYADDPKLVSWADWRTGFGPALPDGGVGATWATTCAASESSDAIVGTLFTALSAYAAALKTVAANSDYAGADIGGAVTSLDALAGAIPGAPTAVTNTLKALGSSGSQPGPAGQLAAVVKKAYTAGHVKEVVRDANPSVNTILEGIQTYLDAVGLQETLWENDLNQLLTSVGSKELRLPETQALQGPQAPAQTVPAAGMPQGEPTAKTPKGKAIKGEVPAAPPATSEALSHPPLNTNAAELMTFHEFAQRWSQTMDATRKKQAAMQDAVKQLEAAQKALVSADGKNDSPDLVTLLGTVTQILNDISA